MLRRNFIKAMCALATAPVIGPKIVKPYTDKKGWTKKITTVSSIHVDPNNGNVLIVCGNDMIVKDGIIVNMKQRTWKHGNDTVS
jgi:hypothetical protein